MLFNQERREVIMKILGPVSVIILGLTQRGITENFLDELILESKSHELCRVREP
jgi:hypothetical protein